MECTLPSVSWDQMLREIERIFSDDSVDIDHVIKLLESYSSNPEDWNKYAMFDVHRYVYII